MCAGGPFRRLREAGKKEKKGKGRGKKGRRKIRRESFWVLVFLVKNTTPLSERWRRERERERGRIGE